MRLVPLWLKLAYTAFMIVWVPAIWIGVGPWNYLWFCDLANFGVLLGLWWEHRLLLSSQAVAVVLVQFCWLFDVAARLTLGFHPIGGTEYMFDPLEPLLLRGLSCFHAVMPFLLLWLVRRLGYDRRGLWLQIGIAAVALPVSYLGPPMEANVNWVHAPFGIEQTLLSPLAYLGVCFLVTATVLYPLNDLLLRWWVRRGGGVVISRNGDADSASVPK